MSIREASDKDFDAIWSIFRDIASAGETYAYPRNITKEEAFKLWMKLPRKTFVALLTKRILFSGNSIIAETVTPVNIGIPSKYFRCRQRKMLIF